MNRIDTIMTNTSPQTSHDRDIEAFLASIDPKNVRDGKYLREIAAARQAVEDADRRLRAAVANARSVGDSWTMIGIALRTSKQNAFRKYGHAD